MESQRWWSPRLWPGHLLLIAVLAATTWLGFWQFSGWQQARDNAAEDRTTETPVAIQDAIGPDDPFPGDALSRPVVVEGTWVPDSTLYVTDRPQDGRDGVWAVTPLAVGGAGKPALLVVRGWAPTVADAPAPPTGQAEMVVWLQPPEGRPGVTDDDPRDDEIPQLRMADALQHVDQDLYGAFGVVADRAADGDWPVGDKATNPGTAGLEQVQPPQLPEVGWTTAARNFFYGIEWWIFGAFAIFVWVQWVRERLGLKPPKEEPADDDAVPSQA